MIEVQGLTKDYGARRAIDHLSFHAERGEILGFLGPNGAGKTTTMRVLCGYMPPTMGVAKIAGFDVIHDSLEVRKRVGYLPETVPLYPDMSVREYLTFMAELRHLEDPGGRVAQVIERIHLQERADSQIGYLSKGMRQRVGLAQALLHEPEVLLLDEPTLGLDPAQIIEVRSLIQEIGREHTVLLSTHILSEAQQICNRVLIINKGKIVAEDTPESLQARLTGAQEVRIRVAGETAGLEDVVQALPGVTHVTAGQDGGIQLAAAPGQDIRPAVARAVVSAGYDLLELCQVGMSLEEIFLQLTRDDQEEPNLFAPDENLSPPDEGGELEG